MTEDHYLTGRAIRFTLYLNHPRKYFPIQGHCNHHAVCTDSMVCPYQSVHVSVHFRELARLVAVGVLQLHGQTIQWCVISAAHIWPVPVNASNNASKTPGQAVVELAALTKVLIRQHNNYFMKKSIWELALCVKIHSSHSSNLTVYNSNSYVYPVRWIAIQQQLVTLSEHTTMHK